jgi:dipeptidyl aminopeptidase/acylaminoacyl peptidase
MKSRLLLVFVAITVLAGPTFAQKRNITEKDLFNFVWIADPQVSPDGSRIAFLRVTVNDKKDGYNTSIWTVSTGTGDSRQMTAGPRDSQPRWSPTESTYVLCEHLSKAEGSSRRNSSCVDGGRRRHFNSHVAAWRRQSAMVAGRQDDRVR